MTPGKSIFIASDHAGVQLKSFLISQKSNYNWIDLGPHNETSVDYPDFAKLVCNQVLTHKGSLGVLICGTGIGMSIAANRFKGIRAALCHSVHLAALTRQHNDANILCLGARELTSGLALDILTEFLITDFEGGRHQNRVLKIE